MATLFGELWMVFLCCLLLFLYQYMVIYIKENHIWQNRVSSNVHMVSGLTRQPSSKDNDAVST